MDTLISKYMTSEQAAEQLGICTPHLYRLCRARRIRYRKHGKKFLFTLADLEAYIESIAVEPSGPKVSEENIKLKHIRA